jgi:hypothetical protein
MAWVEPRLLQRREVHEHYPYREFSRPPPLKPINLAPPLKATGMVPSPAVDALVRQFEESTIVSRPTKRIEAIRQELTASSAGLRLVQYGYPLARVVALPSERYSLEEPKIIGVTFPDTFSSKTDYVSPPGSIERNSGTDIRNQFNLLKHSIQEEDRIRNNHPVEELHRQNRRRPYATMQEFHDFRRYGRKEAHERAQRLAAVSPLEERRRGKWWPDFGAECAALSDNLYSLEIFAAMRSLDEFSTVKVYRMAPERGRDGAVMGGILERANERAGIMPDFKLKMILDSEEWKTEQVAKHCSA